MKLLLFLISQAVVVGIAYSAGWTSRRWTIRRAELEQAERDRAYAPLLKDAHELATAARRTALRSGIRSAGALEYLQHKKLQGEHGQFYRDWLSGPGPREYSAGAQGEDEFAAALGEERRALGVKESNG